MRRPLVTLTTDFGDADWYVGALRGAILSVGTGIAIADITHNVPRHDVDAGAFAVCAAARAFPANTVHCVVVDPGVGSARTALAVRAGDSYFVGPDNGVLSPAISERAPHPQDVVAVALEPERVTSEPLSATFHGRDLFAPAAARLALGEDLVTLGRRVTEWVTLPTWASEPAERGRIAARIVHVDSVGNVVTNVRVAGAPYLTWRPPEGGAVRVRTSYASVADGEALLIPGSAGYVEIAVRNGSAASRWGLTRGSMVYFEVTSEGRHGS